MHEGLTPDLSLGTHFFNDIVETNIIYLGVSPGRREAIFNNERLQAIPNKLLQLIPESQKWTNAVFVIDPSDIHPNCSIFLHADTLEQVGLVFLAEESVEVRDLTNN